MSTLIAGICFFSELFSPNFGSEPYGSGLLFEGWLRLIVEQPSLTIRVLVQNVVAMIVQVSLSGVNLFVTTGYSGPNLPSERTG